MCNYLENMWPTSETTVTYSWVYIWPTFGCTCDLLLGAPKRTTSIALRASFCLCTTFLMPRILVTYWLLAAILQTKQKHILIQKQTHKKEYLYSSVYVKNMFHAKLQIIGHWLMLYFLHESGIEINYCISKHLLLTLNILRWEEISKKHKMVVHVLAFSLANQLSAWPIWLSKESKRKWTISYSM